MAPTRRTIHPKAGSAAIAAVCCASLMRSDPVVFHPVLDRAIALLVFATAAICVYVLAQVTPDARGHGTHEQLGMLPCSWPSTLNAPCPTCGATTAACHIVHLSPIRAVATQPFGAAVALAGIALGGWGLVAVVTGRNFLGGLARLPYGTIAWGSLLLFLTSWGYTYLTFAP